jgi:4-amino-4-deoxy-L-arabinose transferase-like glycosyltransferase
LRNPTEFRAAGAALAVVLACTAIWTALPTVLLPAPHGDNVEQLNWSHVLQWGYFKHPPLPTWLLRGAIAVFGPSAALTYALAMACVAFALLLLWLCARQVMEPRGALIALLVSSGNYYLMGRGSFLNHNTVMLPFVALSTWAVLRIVRGAGWRMWLVLGLAQAFGLLTKYQMGLIAIANAAALLAAGVHRQPRFGRHLALAAAATLVPLIPHVVWLVHHHFSTFTYAGRSLLADQDPAQRLVSGAGFVAQQLVRLAPALMALAMAPLIALAWRPSPSAPLQPASTTADAAALRALAVMALTPIVAIVLLVLVVGVAPQNHWGATTTLLIPLLLVSRSRLPSHRSLAAVAAATVLCHAGAIAWNVIAWKTEPAVHDRFAARSLAALAQRHWSQYQSGPIRVVAGPDWEAGSIALYLPGLPAVLPEADFRRAPWIDQALISRCGALVIGRTDQPLEQQLVPPLAARVADLTVLEAMDQLGRQSAVEVGLIAPAPGSGCP